MAKYSELDVEGVGRGWMEGCHLSNAEASNTYDVSSGYMGVLRAKLWRSGQELAFSKNIAIYIMPYKFILTQFKCICRSLLAWPFQKVLPTFIFKCLPPSSPRLAVSKGLHTVYLLLCFQILSIKMLGAVCGVL